MYAISFCHYALHHYFNMTTIVMTVSLSNAHICVFSCIKPCTSFIQTQKMVKKPYGHVEWFAVAACR